MKPIFTLFITLFLIAQGTATRASESLPVNTSNPYIWDNDTNLDVFTQEFVMALAHNGTINLIGISLSPNPYNGSRSEDLQAVVTKARNIGWRNIPDATWDLGSFPMTALARPTSGNIDDTNPLDTAPARMIRDKVLSVGTPSKPVVIGAGGALTTVASGYLLAKNAGRGAEFASKVVVMANSGEFSGTPSMSSYNTAQDEWASYICLQRMKYIVVSFPQNHVGNPVPWDFINTLPDNELTRYMQAKKTSWPYGNNHEDGDAGVVLAFIRPTLGGYFSNTTRISFDRWAPWPSGWGQPGPNSQNWNCYLADMKVKVDPNSDDIMTNGYSQTVADNEWKNAVGAAFGTVSPPPPPPPPPSAALLAHWKLDETSGSTANDASGNNHPASLSGNPVWEPASGKINGDLNLDGNGDYLNIGTGVRPATAITVSFWIYPKVLTNGAGLVADLNYNGGSYYGINWDIGTDGSTYWRAGQGNAGDAYARSPAGTLATNQWIHLAVTWQNNVTTFYKNGVPMSTIGATNATQILYNGSAGMTMGNNQTGLNAKLDDVRIHNFALSPSEILALYNQSGSSTVAVTGVSVSPTSVSPAVGATSQLTATVSPANATNKTVSWSSSNASVASVNSNGQVSAVAAGSATITVTTQDGGKTANCVVTVTASPPPPPPPTGLLAQWKLDEASGSTASDASGNNHPATINGNPVWEPAGGKINGDLNLDGNGDYLTVGIGVRPATALTVSCWIYPKVLTNGAGLVADLNYNGGSYYGILWDVGSDGSTYWRAGQGNAGDSVARSPAGTLATNQWIHLAVTWQNNVTTFYKNGAQVATIGSTNASQILYNGSPGLTMGLNQTGLNAKLDDVRIYNAALSQTEIQALYNQTSTLVAPQQPPPPPPPATLALSAPWQTADIGSVGLAGSASVTNNVYTLKGSGADVWYAADAFRFAYQPLNADGQIIARVSSVGNTDGWAKAGVMIRQSLNANSAYIFAMVTPTGITSQRRNADGVQAQTLSLYTQYRAPYWVKLLRLGSNIKSYHSADGVNWTLMESVNFTWSANIYVGLAVTSHNNGALCTATFDNVSVVP